MKKNAASGLAALSETGLIERIRRKTRVDRSVIRGIGDDAAVLRFRKDRYLLFAADMIIEGVHFRRPDAAPEEIGHKALAVNLSDVAAMGGIPRHALVSVGLPKKFSPVFVDGLYAGLRRLARRFRVNVVGGDTNSSPVLVIDVAVLGEVEKRCLVLRSGAKPGDAVMVTGCLGGSGAGRHLRFIPRLAESRFLVRNFRLHAMIDVSDGLATDLHHICRESGVGALIRAVDVPVSPAARSFAVALTEGEDFELLFTLPAAQADKLLRRASGKFRLTRIGTITEKKEGVKLIEPSGKTIPLAPAGFQHF